MNKEIKKKQEKVNNIEDNQEKNSKLKQFEEYRKQFIQKIDSQIDKLYKQRNYIKEVILNKEELKKRRIGVWKKFIRSNFWTNLRYIISMPFIYMMIVPGLIMHLMLEIYHQVCFRLYRIPRVKASEHFIFDRKKLPYLNWFEKFNCFYCSYYNCLVSYMQEIVGRTERFWCPIKHSKRMPNAHKHYDLFTDYSDANNFRKNWEELRRFEEYRKKP